MWIKHIHQIIDKYQSKTPEKHTDYLDLNLDLPFAKFMIELLRPSVEFMKVEDYISTDKIIMKDKKKIERRGNGFFLNHNTRKNVKYNDDHWLGNITFKGICDGNEHGPSPVKFRHYLQKVILDEINSEYFKTNMTTHQQEPLFNLLNKIVDNTNSSKKITILLNSISDIITEDLF